MRSAQRGGGDTPIIIIIISGCLCRRGTNLTTSCGTQHRDSEFTVSADCRLVLKLQIFIFHDDAARLQSQKARHNTQPDAEWRLLGAREAEWK